MRELHLPDGKPVVINPELIAYLYSFGEDATLIGFTGSATLTVQGSYEDVLVELGLLDASPPPPDEPDHDDLDASVADEQMMEADDAAQEQERRLLDRSRLF